MKRWQIHLFGFIFGIGWYITLGYLMFNNLINLYLGIACLLLTAFITIGLNAKYFIQMKKENI